MTTPSARDAMVRANHRFEVAVRITVPSSTFAERSRNEASLFPDRPASRRAA